MISVKTEMGVRRASSGARSVPPLSARFDWNVASGLPWRYTAPQPVEVRPGDDHLVEFPAISFTSDPIVGTATFGVTPMIASAHFDKMQCFCFIGQRLMPGETVELAVSLFVGPAFVEDSDAKNVDTIALSCTFFDKGQAALERL